MTEHAGFLRMRVTCSNPADKTGSRFRLPDVLFRYSAVSYPGGRIQIHKLSHLRLQFLT